MRVIKTKSNTKSSRVGNESGKLTQTWSKTYKKYLLKHLKEAHFLIFDYWVQSDLNVKSNMDTFAFIPA